MGRPSAVKVTRGSPPTERVVRLLDLLAAHPGRPMTFSEIAREVHITKATCHALLVTLTDSGYLVRDPVRKTYALGPALVGIGRAAQDSFPAVRQVRGQLEQLARRTGYPCTAAAVLGGDIVVVDQAAPPAGDRAGADRAGADRWVRTGQRIPFAPPFGALTVAWYPPADVAAWIARAPAPVPEKLRREYEQLVRGLRRQGYAVSPLDDAGLRLRGVLAELADGALSDDLRAKMLDLLAALRPRDYLPRELAGARALAVNTVSAPVFDADGHPAFTVALQVADPAMPTQRVRALGTQLATATAAMTRAVDGRRPAATR